MSESLMIQGKSIPYRRTSIPVSDCLLDPANPRIQFLVGQRAGDTSQQELDSLIWAKDAVKALAQSIHQNGGVYESLIVQKKDGKYLVREGNCRTVSARHLAEQYPDDVRFKNVPAMVFEGSLNEEDLAVLLADMHVSGKIRWDAYEQAKHVSVLYNVYGKTYDWLGNHLRLSKGTINELLLAYAAMTDFLVQHPEPANIRKFSFFHEIMKKRELREKYKENPEFKQQFHGWMANGKLIDAKQVRKLPAILESKDATKALETKGFEEASKVLIKNDPSLESDLFSALKRATEQLKKAPASEIQDLRAGNAQKIIMLRDLARAIEDIYTLSSLKQ